MADSNPPLLVVCNCQSSKCYEQTYRSNSGVIKHGALVSRRILRHHQHGDRVALWDQPLVGMGSGRKAHATHNFINEGALLEYVQSTVDDLAPLEFYHAPGAQSHDSALDGFWDIDDDGPYKLTATATNSKFLDARAVVSNLSRIFPTYEPLWRDAQQFSQRLSDWKSREWSRQYARLHRDKLLETFGASAYNNSMNLKSFSITCCSFKAKNYRHELQPPLYWKQLSITFGTDIVLHAPYVAYFIQIGHIPAQGEQVARLFRPE
jgi:hypothetical protein